MRFARFLWKNIVRSKRRTVLTVLSFAVSILLLTVLAGVLATFDSIQKGSNLSLRLVVSQKIAGAWKSEVPEHYGGEIKSLPGVSAVTSLSFIGGEIAARDFVFGFAVDGATYRDVITELRDPKNLDEATWQAFMSDRNAAIIGERSALKHGWKVGSDVELNTWGNLPHIRFHVVGLTREPSYTDNFIMHLDTMQKTLGAPAEGIVAFFNVRVRDEASIAPATRAIEEHFAAAQTPLLAKSEKASTRDLLQTLGDFRSAIQIVLFAVLVAIFLGSLNSLTMALRERTREMAVLRAIGYSPRRILALVALESALVAGFGGLLGAATAYVLLNNWVIPIPVGFRPSFDLGLDVAAQGIVAALVVGLLAAIWPARKALRVPVAIVLRRA